MEQIVLKDRFSASRITDEDVQQFQNIIYAYYTSHGRKFPWRETRDPYCILVSEIMLQQTQTDRVIQKYEEFITAFPNVQALAAASLQQVFQVWQGLGYNRRAVALKKIAELIMSQYDGEIPTNAAELEKLPGIGHYSAAAICAFAFHQPTMLIETNIRTVYIHFFFHNKKGIRDQDIQPLIEKTLDDKDPRQWYYALMDYGVMLKKRYPQVTRKSAHYTKQKPFQGSNRQIRGLILKELVAHPRLSCQQLTTTLDKQPDKIQHNLRQLEKEGMIAEKNGKYAIMQQ